jgi:hypothetical protein
LERADSTRWKSRQDKHINEKYKMNFDLGKDVSEISHV